MFIDKICERAKKTSPVALGIDPNLDLFPEIFDVNLQNENSIADFLCLFSQVVIDAASEFVCAVKFQSAYFEAWGSMGTFALAKCMHYAKQAQVPVILDVKRGDIGSTAQAYAQAYLGPDSRSKSSQASDLRADAITLNPYLGKDSLTPFLERAALYQKGLFILVKTSNEGSSFIQDKMVSNEPIFMQVAHFVDEISQIPMHMGSSGWSNIGAVVGASYLNEARLLREAMPKTLFLVPGVGSQGGDLRDIASLLLDQNHEGAIFPISRGLTYFSEQPRSFGHYQDQIKNRLKGYIDAIS